MAMKIKRNLSSETCERIKAGKIPQAKVDSYMRLLDRIEKEILPHPVIVNNKFTTWFQKGEADREDVKHFLIQFSVFSNLFIEAQLKKVINAPNLESMRVSKEILMNELGVVFRSPNAVQAASPARDDVEPNLVQREGTVDGGTMRFAAAHFEWLLRMTSHLGLKFSDIGKRRHGSPSTLFFCDELARLYGAEDPHMGLGASFAVENWAAAGFWKELISGLETFKKHACPKLPLAFFLWHDQVEDQHAAHTWDELEEEYFQMDLNEAKFLSAGQEMLNGVEAFWDGLNDDRLKRTKNRRMTQ